MFLINENLFLNVLNNKSLKKEVYLWQTFSPWSR